MPVEPERKLEVREAHPVGMGLMMQMMSSKGMTLGWARDSQAQLRLRRCRRVAEEDDLTILQLLQVRGQKLRQDWPSASVTSMCTNLCLMTHLLHLVEEGL